MGNMRDQRQQDNKKGGCGCGKGKGGK